MSDGELCAMTAGEMMRRVQAGEFSRRTLIEAHLARIEQCNGALNAIVERRDEEALDEADAADRDAANRAHLPLDGVPISIKDFFDVAGMKHTEGVRAMAERRSPKDEIAIARLRAAGSFIILPSSWSPNETRQRTRNARPYEISNDSPGHKRAKALPRDSMHL